MHQADNDAKAGEITALLRRLGDGDTSIEGEVMALVYGQLRALAGSFMRSQPAGHTLQPTALANEAYLKLVGRGTTPSVKDRQHFFALAARAMRQILVDHARRRHASKRGGELQRVTLEDGLGLTGGREREVDLIDLDNALRRLEGLHERQSRVVELRYFGGMTLNETAAALGISADTVKDDWTAARAWLRVALRDTGKGASSPPAR